MSDQPPESRPDPDPTQSLPAQPGGAPPADQAPVKQRFQDRLWNLRSVIAVALASVIVGGLGGAALASAGQDDDEGRLGPGMARFNRGGPDGPPGMMDERRRERMKEWREERGMGQRQWREDGPPGVPPSDLPTPPKPTATG